jgi:pimeloyl-ACP methyl ester carboxylesterase
VHPVAEEADVDTLPIVYCRGYAGATSQIDTTVDDPFYGFNDGATHTRVNGDGVSRFLQFEGPMLRLMGEYGYQPLVRGSQAELLADAAPDSLPSASIWISRFYDASSTTFDLPPAKPGSLLQQIRDGIASVGHLVHDRVTSGFDIERAALELYVLTTAVIDKTAGVDRVNLVAHSMGGLVARCMMQKICGTDGRREARDIVAKLVTLATPNGGIGFTDGALDWAMETFGPIGSDIFSPRKMYGYLTKGASFGDEPPDDEEWDPRVIPDDVFDVDDVFCVVGTDQADYGASKYLVGPQSDGLVQIRNAWVVGAHRAYVHKSHSGRYGIVSSEEAYQNLARFLFGPWNVRVEFCDLSAATQAGVSWQADVRLAIRGLSVLMTEQSAAHYNPVQLTADATAHTAPLIETFLLQREPPPDLPATEVTSAGDASMAAPDGVPDGAETATVPTPNTSRYALNVKIYQVSTSPASGAFDFSDHLEQIGDWSDVLVVDVGPRTPDGEMGVWTGWNSTIDGPISGVALMPDLLATTRDGGRWTGSVPLPAGARALPIMGDEASLRFTITER